MTLQVHLIGGVQRERWRDMGVGEYPLEYKLSKLDSIIAQHHYITKILDSLPSTCLYDFCHQWKQLLHCGAAWCGG